MLRVQVRGYLFVMTCGACPEQYDIYRPANPGDLADERHPDHTQVGYFRLRHGSLTVNCPGYAGQLVLDGSPRGDGVLTADERVRWLRFAAKAVERWEIETTVAALHQ